MIPHSSYLLQLPRLLLVPPPALLCQRRRGSPVVLLDNRSKLLDTLLYFRLALAQRQPIMAAALKFDNHLRETTRSKGAERYTINIDKLECQPPQRIRVAPRARSAKQTDHTKGTLCNRSCPAPHCQHNDHLRGSVNLQKSNIDHRRCGCIVL